MNLSLILGLLMKMFFHSFSNKWLLGIEKNKMEMKGWLLIHTIRTLYKQMRATSDVILESSFLII
jgi:hypothetical protein